MKPKRLKRFIYCFRNEPSIAEKGKTTCNLKCCVTGFLISHFKISQCHDTLSSSAYTALASFQNKSKSLKHQPHEGDNLDERIVAIPCKRVYGATQTRPWETSGCSGQRCTVKVSNKTRLFCSQKQLRYPAKKLPLFSLADAVDVDYFGGTFHLSQMARKRSLFTENQPNS